MTDSSHRPTELPFGHPGLEPSLSMSDEGLGLDHQAIRTIRDDKPNAFWFDDEIFRSVGGTDMGASLADFYARMTQLRAGRQPVLLLITDGPADPLSVEAARKHLCDGNPLSLNFILAHEVSHQPMDFGLT